MSLTTINVGTYANSGNGAPLRTAFIEVNDNFSFLQGEIELRLVDSDLDTLRNDVAGKAPLIHTHQISQVFGLSGSLALKADRSEVDLQIASLNNTITTLIPDAPIDGNSYIRKDGSWEQINNTTNILETEFILHFNTDNGTLTYETMVSNLNNNWNITRQDVGVFRLENGDYTFDKNNTTVYIGSMKAPLYSYTVDISGPIELYVDKLDLRDGYERDDYGLTYIAIKINYKK